MPIRDQLLPEFDQEIAATRRLVALVPDARFAWRPHPRSWTVGELATHLANIPTWLGGTLRTSELDLAPPGGPAYTPPRAASTREVLEQLDRSAADARAALAAVSDADLAQPWTLKKGGAALFTLPRLASLRSFVLSHLVHHRGQLTVYLRLLDVPLPSTYGPTADTPF
jgi:uncharacterized damage-inducible protein DinB